MTPNACVFGCWMIMDCQWIVFHALVSSLKEYTSSKWDFRASKPILWLELNISHENWETSILMIKGRTGLKLLFVKGRPPEEGYTKLRTKDNITQSNKKEKTKYTHLQYKKYRHQWHLSTCSVTINNSMYGLLIDNFPKDFISTLQ